MAGKSANYVGLHFILFLCEPPVNVWITRKSFHELQVLVFRFLNLCRKLAYKSEQVILMTDPTVIKPLNCKRKQSAKIKYSLVPIELLSADNPINADVDKLVLMLTIKYLTNNSTCLCLPSRMIG